MEEATNVTRVAVIGAGSWGTALARSLAVEGQDVVLWSRREEHAQEMRDTRRNAVYLPDQDLPASISFTSNLAEAVLDAEIWLVAVPSQSVRDVIAPLNEIVDEATTIVSVAKGIEAETLLTTSGVLRDVLVRADPRRMGVLYGPSHAEEVAKGQPTSVVASLPDEDAAAFVQAVFMAPSLRVYANPDLVGVEIAGSVKNVIAIAAGMGDGLGLGDNTKAALVTRGLAEITRLGLAMGASSHTFAGLAGLGDLVVTCFSQHSRNRAFGERVGRGMTVEDALAASTMVVEGVRTTASVIQLAKRFGVEMPIANEVSSILFDGCLPQHAVAALMERDAKQEAAHFAPPPDFDGSEP